MENSTERFPELRELLELPIDVAKLALGERANFPARGLAAVPVAEQLRQLVEREADGEGALDQQDAVDRFRRIGAVAIGEALRPSQQSPALVVPERIDADPRPAGDFAGSKLAGGPCFRHGCAV